jgi:hypothetical protein
MKKNQVLAIELAVLLGVGSAWSQSLGDYARTVRKNKVEPTTASRHFDNDNLPTNDSLSVVGPPPAVEATKTTEAAAADPASAVADRQKAAEEWKQKIAIQQEKIDSLSRELDLEQREYRLRAAAMYGDAGARLRNAAQWDKDDAQYKSDVESKQKSLDAARQQLSELQEQARKEGVVQREKDSEKGAHQDPDSGKDNEKAKEDKGDDKQ